MHVWLVADAEKRNRCIERNIYQQIKTTKRPERHEENKLTH